MKAAIGSSPQPQAGRFSVQEVGLLEARVPECRVSAAFLLFSVFPLFFCSCFSLSPISFLPSSTPQPPAPRGFLKAAGRVALLRLGNNFYSFSCIKTANRVRGFFPWIFFVLCFSLEAKVGVVACKS